MSYILDALRRADAERQQTRLVDGVEGFPGELRGAVVPLGGGGQHLGQRLQIFCHVSDRLARVEDAVGIEDRLDPVVQVETGGVGLATSYASQVLFQILQPPLVPLPNDDTGCGHSQFVRG